MKVSVILTTYNRADMVQEAVETVLAQTYSDFKLYVIDDGSTDSTSNVLTSYRSRLIYLYQPNRGVSAARNRGIRMSDGELVCFLDSDDLWKPTKLARQVAYMTKNPNHHICYTDEIWIRRGTRVNPRKIHTKHSGWIFDKVLPLCIISPSSVMLRRSVLDDVGPFDETLPACEDYDLWIRIAAAYPIYFIPEQLIVKRGGFPGQLSQSYWGNDRFRVRALEKALHSGELDEVKKRLVLEELVTKCNVLATGCRKRGKAQKAALHERKVATYNRMAEEPRGRLSGRSAGIAVRHG